MYLTNDHHVGGKSISGVPEDLSFIVRYSWESSKHMQEAIKIMLSARLECGENVVHVRSDEVTREYMEVQLSLASNPQTSTEVLNFLAKVGDKRVCERIAGHPRCSEKTMQSLLHHPDAEVRAELSENPCCPITVLYRLATDSHPDVRFRLAENPHLPISILNELSNDENPYIAARAETTLHKSNRNNVLEASFPRFVQPASVLMMAT